MTDHSQRATDLLADAKGQTLDAAALTVAEAQTHALLALTQEVRALHLTYAAALRPAHDKLHALVDEYLTAATKPRETT